MTWYMVRQVAITVAVGALVVGQYLQTKINDELIKYMQEITRRRRAVEEPPGRE